MSVWSEVGKYLEQYGPGAVKLVGSLAAGNITGAAAAGISMIQGATETTDPVDALEKLKTDPQTMIKLQEIAKAREADIHRHLETIQEKRLQDAQEAHRQAQETIRAGDRSEAKVVKFTRPGLAWSGFVIGGVYAGICAWKNFELKLDVLSVFMSFPWAYMGLRQTGHWVNAISDAAIGKAQALGKKSSATPQ